MTALLHLTPSTGTAHQSHSSSDRIQPAPIFVAPGGKKKAHIGSTSGTEIKLNTSTQISFIVSHPETP